MSAIASGKEDLSSDDENKNFKVSQVAFNDKVVKEDPNPSFEHRIVQIQNGEIFKSRFEICNKLGQGQYGVVHKVKKILKGSLDSISSPSPSMKIQIMCGKVCLRCKGKSLLDVVNKFFVFKSLLTTPSNVLPLHLKPGLPQANFPAHILNFH